MSGDITDILKDWEYDSDNQIRIIQADDGRQVLQVRQPLGVEQYELDGRPDGKRPFDKETALEEYETRLAGHKALHGTEDGFTITHDDFATLQGEGVLFYFRYLVLFQIGDFARTARDTEHNLALFSLIERFGDSDEDRRELLQYKPYVVRMNAIARAMISLHKEMKAAAEEIINGAISTIEDMHDIDTPAFQFERVRSLNYLKATLKQIHDKRSSPVESLKKELAAAIDNEEYERAAALRDRIAVYEVDDESVVSDDTVSDDDE
ncbi:MAG TPA: UvrB/UvrC motif-containing protein [Spirochaetia bacterium]